MTTSKFLNATSLVVGQNEAQREEVIEKITYLLQKERCSIIWLSPEEAGDEVAYYDWEYNEIIINSLYREDPIIVKILVHEMIHFCQCAFNWLKAEVKGEELVIKELDYRCDKTPWEEYLFSMGYDNPEVGGYVDTQRALAMEMPAYLLQESYEWFIEWYEIKYKAHIEFYESLGIL